MTRTEADRIISEIKISVSRCINTTPLRRKGDLMYVKGMKDLSSLTEEIIKDHIDKT